MRRIPSAKMGGPSQAGLDMELGGKWKRDLRELESDQLGVGGPRLTLTARFA